MAVMAELLLRGCNAAIPEVDHGTDVFAFLEEREDSARIQVKTAHGKLYKNGDGYNAQFHVPTIQLRRPEPPDLYYALAVRLNHGWGDYLVIGRKNLNELWNGEEGFGTLPPSNDLRLNVCFRPDRVTCGAVDLTGYRNAWHKLPPLRPPVEL
jgi:hypothetical protein